MNPRPIVLMILALTPPAPGLGDSAETKGPLAIAVIGGMLSSTLLTLVVVAATHSLIERCFERRQGEPGISQET